MAEKQQQRMAGTPQQRRAARFARPILVLLLGGIAFVAGGFTTYNSSEEQFRPDSWGHQHLGNQGAAICMALIGTAMFIGGILLVRKLYRERKAEEAQSARLT